MDLVGLYGAIGASVTGLRMDQMDLELPFEGLQTSLNPLYGLKEDSRLLI